MEEAPISSGDFLADVEITIQIRSGQTDLNDLQKLIKAFSASLTSLIDTKIVLTESEVKVTNSYGKKLTVLKRTYFKE